MSDEKMELHELKTAWARLDERCAVDFGRVERLARELAADKQRKLVHRALWLPAAELVTGGLGLLVVGAGFLRAGGAVYLGCLLFTGAVLAVLMASAIAQIVMLAGLDPTAPVLAAQRRLGRVSALRVLEWKWVLLLSPVLWTPFLVVAVEVPLRVLAGGSMTGPIFGGGFVLASLLIGGVVSGLLWLLSAWLTTRLAGTSLLRRIVDDLAGRRLVAARDFLTRLDGFERGA
jgi:hypothetical protein